MEDLLNSPRGIPIVIVASLALLLGLLNVYLLYCVDSVSHPPSRAASLCWTHVYMQGGQLLG